MADAPSFSSMRSSWLYFEMRSVRLADPVLIWPALVATAKSAMMGSSVSPEIGLAHLLFDAQQLVVLRDAVGAAGRSGLDLAGVGGHGEVGDDGIFGFTRAVRDHRGVARIGRHLHGFQGFADCADLVELDEDRVGDALVDAALEDLRIGYVDVVAH